MKIQKFLNELKDLIMFTPDINKRTYKLILQAFKQNLSEKEFDRWKSEIIILQNINSVQLSMNSAYELAKQKGLVDPNEVIK